MVGLVMLAVHIYRAYSYGDGVEPGARIYMSGIYIYETRIILAVYTYRYTGTGRRFFNITMLKHVELADP